MIYYTHSILIYKTHTLFLCILNTFFLCILRKVDGVINVYNLYYMIINREMLTSAPGH